MLDLYVPKGCCIRHVAALNLEGGRYPAGSAIKERSKRCVFFFIFLNAVVKRSSSRQNQVAKNENQPIQRGRGLWGLSAPRRLARWLNRRIIYGF